MLATMPKKKPRADRHLPFKQVRIPLNLYEKLRELANRNDRPVSREIKRALEAHLRANEESPPAG
jgi:predicted DNA-binding protein